MGLGIGIGIGMLFATTAPPPGDMSAASDSSSAGAVDCVAWLPSDVASATLKFWGNPANLTPGAITAWPDETVNGYDLDLGAATAEATGLNGGPSVLFNGTSDYLHNLNGLALEFDGEDTPYSFVAAVQWLGGAGSGVMAALGRESTAANGRSFLWSISGNRSIFRADDTGASVSPNPGGAWGATAVVAAQIFSGTTMAYYQNGAEVMAPTACNNGTCSFTRAGLGATATGTPASFGNSRWGNVCWYAGELSAPDRELVETWIQAIHSI